MKNYIREGQKLPLYGIGPYLVCGMAALVLVGILLSLGVLKSGFVGGAWTAVFIAAGCVFIIAGAAVWFISALRSDMDNIIAENRLKTDGIYAWVRNPMYSGFMLMLAGIVLLCHNLWLLIIPFINWVIMTIVLKNTEEKWLSELFGRDYSEYCGRVNRCWPWFPRKGEMH